MKKKEREKENSLSSTLVGRAESLLKKKINFSKYIDIR